MCFRERVRARGDDAGTFRRARARASGNERRRARRVLFLWIVNRRSSNFWQLQGLGLHDASDASFVAVHAGPSHRGAPSGLPEHAPCRTHPTTRLPRRSLSERCVPHPRVSPFATPRHRHRPGRRRRRAWCADSPPTRDAAHALTHPTSPRASPRRAQGKEAVLATRTREVAARRTAGESAKRRRAERVASRAEETATRPKKASDDGSDDEVEDLDEDVVHAVADRHLAQPAKRDTTGTRREKLSKKAAKRAAIRAAREAEEGYVGGGVWEKDGYEVVAAGAGTTGVTAARRRRERSWRAVTRGGGTRGRAACCSTRRRGNRCARGGSPRWASGRRDDDRLDCLVRWWSTLNFRFRSRPGNPARRNAASSPCASFSRRATR